MPAQTSVVCARVEIVTDHRCPPATSARSAGVVGCAGIPIITGAAVGERLGATLSLGAGGCGAGAGRGTVGGRRAVTTGRRHADSGVAQSRTIAAVLCHAGDAIDRGVEHFAGYAGIVGAGVVIVNLDRRAQAAFLPKVIETTLIEIYHVDGN